MKNLSKVIITLVMLLAISPVYNIANAAKQTKIEETNMIDPVKNPEDLSTKKLDNILKKMNFSSEEIGNMSKRVKNQIVRHGGKKAKTVEQEIKHYYTSLDGVKYEITEENKEEINKIKQQDIATFSKENQIPIISIPKSEMSLMSAPTTVGDNKEIGKLSISFYVTKTISGNSTEHEYITFLDWTWSDEPALIWTDEAALAWDNHFTGITGTVDKYNIAVLNGQMKVATSQLKVKDEIYGLKTDIVLGPFDQQYGGISQHIRVPKRYNGETTRLLDIGLSVKAGSITVPSSKLIEQWDIPLNVTVGQ
jgi:hypothetical protein